MAYSALSNFTSGQVPSSSQLNQARDNLNSLHGFNDHGVRLWLSGDQSIPNSTNTEIVWTTIDNTQTGSLWSPGAPQHLTAPVTGHYVVILNAEWLKSTVGERTMGLVVAGNRYQMVAQGSTEGGNNQSAAEPFFMTAGQSLEAYVYQSSGGSLKLRGGSRDRTSIAMWLFGAS